MSSREEILKRIKTNRPTLEVELKKIPRFPLEGDKTSRFCAALETNHATVLRVPAGEDFNARWRVLFPKAGRVVSLVKGIEGTYVPAGGQREHLTSIDLTIIEGVVAIAENGAIWFNEEKMDIRALPFVAEHLLVIINEKDIVANMHEAFDKISVDTGFGVFISGPSKTADIEQKLVIGAHGPRSHTVLVVEDQKVAKNGIVRGE
ncbi:MAG: LUD domain-containing protein [Cyclobacteriaceae bacterium]|nr:LUD domain-containing protein [Cyclobacteriaceae bacterium]